MTKDEIKELKAQQELRAEFEARCKKYGWSIEDVFYSDIEFYVDPNRPDFTWPETHPPRGDRPSYASDATRQRPKVTIRLIR